MKCFFFFIATLLSIMAQASGGEQGSGHDAIPVQTLIYQTINVTILFAGLIYFLKNPIKNFFLDKKTLFLSASEKAQAARAAAEQEHIEIQVRLTKLESTTDESISRARAEAADLKKQLIEEAHIISKRIKSEAESAARLEIEKAKNHLREQMIAESVKLTRTQLNTKVSSEDHKRLQGDFIESIRAVQP